VRLLILIRWLWPVQPAERTQRGGACRLPRKACQTEVVVRAGGRRCRQGCRYDARAQPRAARGMTRPEGRRPASDGADLAQRRESGFRVWGCFGATRNGSRPRVGAVSPVVCSQHCAPRPRRRPPAPRWGAPSVTRPTVTWSPARPALCVSRLSRCASQRPGTSVAARTRPATHAKSRKKSARQR
jgi:hypothetical protein